MGCYPTGFKVMPHFGHLLALVSVTSGCMGQAYLAASIFCPSPGLSGRVVSFCWQAVKLSARASKLRIVKNSFFMACTFQAAHLNDELPGQIQVRIGRSRSFQQLIEGVCILSLLALHFSHWRHRPICQRLFGLNCEATHDFFHFRLYRQQSVWLLT